jgi:mannose-6-phosphate isomerase-like protein (cupin superfamily)
LSPLIKFSRSLGVRLGTLLDDQEDIGPVITRKGLYPKAVRFSDKKTSVASDLDFYSLAHGKAGRHMEPFLIDLFPSSADDTHTSTHEGEEFLYVFFGEVEVIYGKHTYHLKEGDSIYYDSIVEHNVHSLGDKPAKILAVVYAPF